MTRKNAARGIAVLLPLFLMLNGCSNEKLSVSANVDRPEVKGVTVATVALTPVTDYYETAGTVTALTVASVASRVLGAVTSLPVKEGDRVKRGQVLLTIDDRDARERLRAAQSAQDEATKAAEAAREHMALAEITAGRYQKMYDERAISLQELNEITTKKRVAALEYERVRESIRRAAASVAEARVFLGLTRILAPLSGTITEKRIDAGSMAVPGVPLLIVESNDGFEVELNVEENMVGYLKAGAPLDVSIDAIGKVLAGKVTRIIPAMNPQSRTFLVKISLTGPDLRSGLYARVKIPRAEQQAILVPRTALVNRGQLTGLFTVDQKGVIAYRLVRMGKEYGDRIEILSGLNQGDRIIVEGAGKAIDGGLLTNG